MFRFTNKITFCVIAFIAGCFCTTNLFAQNVDPETVYRNCQLNGFHTFVDGNNFQGDFQFPPDWENGFGDRLILNEVYELRFPAGVNATFEGTLTITTNITDDAIGRILVEGTAVNMVTMTEGVEDAGWGGIRILTDPRTIVAGDWDAQMESGNHLRYCLMENVVGEDAPDEVGDLPMTGVGAIVVGSVDVDDAQVFVDRCTIDSDELYSGLIALNDGLYWFRGNTISGYNLVGISCAGPITERADGFLRHVISNNYLTQADHDGIQVWSDNVGADWDGIIQNNILEDLWAEDGITVTGSEDAIVRNNVLENCAIGIQVNGEWCTVENNIIQNCLTGIDGTNPADEVDNCLFRQNINPEEEVNDVVNCFMDNNTCITNDNPDLVDPDGHDFHIHCHPPGTSR